MEKMERPTTMKTKQAWNGLYRGANEDSMRVTRKAAVYNIRLCVKYVPLFCVLSLRH
jgi:hypothetical protein